jgi:hypothetical protein
MDKDKWSFWKKVWIVIEALVGLFVIWIVCTLFTILLTWTLMGIKYGECTAELIEKYEMYIKIGYGAILTICAAQYLQRLYRKYRITDQYGNKQQ